MGTIAAVITPEIVAQFAKGSDWEKDWMHHFPQTTPARLEMQRQVEIQAAAFQELQERLAENARQVQLNKMYAKQKNK